MPHNFGTTLLDVKGVIETAKEAGIAYLDVQDVIDAALPAEGAGGDPSGGTAVAPPKEKQSQTRKP